MKLRESVKKGCVVALSVSMLASSLCIIDTGDKVTAGTYDYATALKYGVTFFDANKCGKDAGDNNAFDWRGACHTTDGQDVGVDLTGGYHDCGDHVKFGITQGYSASVLGWTYYQYRDILAQAGAAEKTLETMKHFCDYFLKSHPTSNVFYYQVGDGGEDHAYWDAPEKQGNRSTIYKADSGSAASDVLGETSAALSIMYLCYKDIDSSYADRCLTAAKELYSMGKTTQGCGKGQSFYDEQSYKDDLSWAASWLYQITGQSSYLSDAESFITGGYGVEVDTWTMCWDNMKAPATIKLYELTKNEKYLTALKGNVDHWKNSVPTTPGGLKYLNSWGACRYAAAEVALLMTYYGFTGDTGAKDLAKRQIDYILGDNPNNMSYIIGFGSNYPKCPHHRAANGYTYANSGNTLPAKNLLLGGLVGGPSQDDRYKDSGVEYENSEVGIDYNASFVAGITALMADGKAANTSSVVVPTVTPTKKVMPTIPVTVTPTPTKKVMPTIPVTVTPTPTKKVMPTIPVTVTPRPTSTPVVQKEVVEVTTNGNEWNSGFSINITVKNVTSDNLENWTMKVKKSDISYTNMWCATATQSGDYYVITPESYAKTLSAGTSYNFGFQGNGSMPKDLKYIIDYSVNGQQYSYSNDNSGEVAPTVTPTKKVMPTIPVTVVPTVTPTKKVMPTIPVTVEPTVTPTKKVMPTIPVTVVPTVTPTKKVMPTIPVTVEPTVTPTKKVMPTIPVTVVPTVTPTKKVMPTIPVTVEPTVTPTKKVMPTIPVTVVPTVTPTKKVMPTIPVTVTPSPTQEAKIVTFNVADDLATGRYSSDFECNGFKFITGGSYFTVDNITRSVDDMTFTSRIRTNGSGTTSKRAIQFTADNAGVLTIYAMSGGSVDRRLTLNLLGRDIQSGEAGSTLTKIQYRIPIAGTYTIYPQDGNVGIFAMELKTF